MATPSGFVPGDGAIINVRIPLTTFEMPRRRGLQYCPMIPAV